MFATCSPCFAFSAKDKICVFVADSFVSDAIVRACKEEGATNVVADTVPIQDLQDFFIAEKPDYVILDGSGMASADQQLEFESKVIAYSAFSRVKRLLLLSSFTLYPQKHLSLNEALITDQLFTSHDDPCLIAKAVTAGKCRKGNDPERPTFILCLYPYLFGPGDPSCKHASTHPLYHIIDRIVSAKNENRPFTVIANDGTAQYDLLYVEEFAKALVHLLKTSRCPEVVNIATGRDLSVEMLTDQVQGIAGYTSEVILDPNCYDLVPRHVLDIRRLQELGWTQTISVQDGLRHTISWYTDAHKRAS